MENSFLAIFDELPCTIVQDLLMNFTSSEILFIITFVGILLTLLSNWGSKDSIGLTEIQLLDSDLSPISLSPSQLSLFDSTPTLTNNGNSSLVNLLNGVTMTTDSEYMWLAGYTGNGIDFKIDLKEDLKLGGVIIWNYNEEMSTGVSLVLFLNN